MHFGSVIYAWGCLFQGVLLGAVEDAPTIVIAAHYDSYGLAPVSQILKHFRVLTSKIRCKF